jgi:flagellar biogenesis protein FliO
VSLLDMEMVWSLIKVVVVLACLTPLIYFTTRWYGRVQKFNQSVIVKERTPLGTNRTLLVVEWEGNQYLLAVTNQQIIIIDKKAKPVEKGGEQPSP